MYLKGNTMNKKKANFFRLMGCVTWLIAIAAFIGLIVDVVNLFKASSGAWPIIATFLNMLAVLTLGCGVGELFFSHACTLDDEQYC